MEKITELLRKFKDASGIEREVLMGQIIGEFFMIDKKDQLEFRHTVQKVLDRKRRKKLS